MKKSYTFEIDDAVYEAFKRFVTSSGRHVSDTVQTLMEWHTAENAAAQPAPVPTTADSWFQRFIDQRLNADAGPMFRLRTDALYNEWLDFCIEHGMPVTFSQTYVSRTVRRMTQATVQRSSGYVYLVGITIKG